MTEKEVLQVYDDIKALKIQGNTNIAKTIAKTLLDYVATSRSHSLEELFEKIKRLGFQLANARDNEPLSINAVVFMLKDIEKCQSKPEVKERLIERIQSFFKYIDESYEIIRLNATNLLKGYTTFYTHCHSSLSRDVLIRINKENPGILVINDETRPLYQGRITARKLSAAGVKVLHSVDSAAVSILLDPRYKKPEVILVGCDGVTLQGDLINKVGTYGIALAAKQANIPFYVVSQSMKIDIRSSKDTVPIEQRAKDEVWKKRPKHVDIMNPAFDLVPAEYITGGYITEKGLLKPEEFRTYSM